MNYLQLQLLMRICSKTKQTTFTDDILNSLHPFPHGVVLRKYERLIVVDKLAYHNTLTTNSPCALQITAVEQQQQLLKIMHFPVLTQNKQSWIAVHFMLKDLSAIRLP